MNYAEKLKDPRWQKKRLKILERDNFTCQKCGASKIELQVHHKKYNDNPWDTPNDSLITLCKYCHEIITDMNLIDENFEKFKIIKWHIDENSFVAFYNPAYNGHFGIRFYNITDPISMNKKYLLKLQKFINDIK